MEIVTIKKMGGSSENGYKVNRSVGSLSGRGGEQLDAPSGGHVVSPTSTTHGCNFALLDVSLIISQPKFVGGEA